MMLIVKSFIWLLLALIIEYLQGIISEQEGAVVQILTGKDGEFEKCLLKDGIFQYAASNDDKQTLNIIKIQALEPTVIVAY